jgi:hypothetical protein
MMKTMAVEFSTRSRYSVVEARSRKLDNTCNRAIDRCTAEPLSVERQPSRGLISEQSVQTEE